MSHDTEDATSARIDPVRATGLDEGAPAFDLSWREFFVRLGNGTLPDHRPAGRSGKRDATPASVC
ncbi:hypothetical protein C4N9_09105 [Pararhodobacter marinus]|uniref:Uncharacterized protein n=1 Tax=Pararhodobacter marinus TaxID=2184063 RepID=A0A2U2CAS8_9RHOB|nr:hypothetical protein [Pararhodobacter marinus]PWE28969.1 hypothetical protein C4N9_09105 [Pararhodobacter marinus]